MPKESIVTQIVIFASIILAIAAVVIISFILMYQKRRYQHYKEIKRIEENFIKEKLRAQVEMQDQTLRSVASEIHDNFNPTLSVINISLASLLGDLPPDVQESLLESKKLIKQMMGEMKNLSSSLNSDHLAQVGFYRAIEKYTSHIHRSGMYDISLNVEGDRFKIPPDKEIILFRMCQEVLNNIIKHAHARKINVFVEYRKTTLCIEISDDGDGFDIQKIAGEEGERDSTGLGNLRKRALVLGAALEISSTPGAGTKVSIYLNVK